ncbi:hypothetical protein AQ436_01755 [Arthrobacter sp. EpRS66]|nr:hypothetical protein AQ436_01755 [Arthrobacter sp. EpRS66]
MGRSLKSAKAAGTRFEGSVAKFLAKAVDDDGIDRQVRTGAKDLGDIRGVRIWGQPVAIECKDVATMALPAWLREAEVERGNKDALVGVVVHKRRGTADPADQYVTMTLLDFAALIAGARPDVE